MSVGNDGIHQRILHTSLNTVTIQIVQTQFKPLQYFQSMEMNLFLSRQNVVSSPQGQVFPSEIHPLSEKLYICAVFMLTS